MYVYIYVYICTYIYVCVYIYVYVIFLFVYICIYVYAYICIYIYIGIHIFLHHLQNMYICTHIIIHIWIYVNIQNANKLAASRIGSASFYAACRNCRIFKSWHQRLSVICPKFLSGAANYVSRYFAGCKRVVCNTISFLFKESDVIYRTTYSELLIQGRFAPSAWMGRQIAFPRIVQNAQELYVM